MKHVLRLNTLLVLSMAVLAVVLTPSAIRYFSLYEQHRAVTFFASALRDARIPSRSVSIHGTHYQVSEGTVTAASSSVPEADALKALELAYETAVAERNPQFGLAGTEPDKLDTQVTELARIQKEQADSLRIPSNIDAVRTSLYPISFLRALATVERARLALIESGSDTDSLSYRSAIRAATDALRRDSELFGTSYKFLGYKDAKFPLFGGTMTSDNVEKAIAALRDSADAQAAIASKRAGCFSGVVRACDVRDITLPLPTTVRDTHDARAVELATDIRSIYKQSKPEYRYSTAGTFVALSSSTCLASVDGPYIFRDLAPKSSSQYRPPILQYLGDIFFSTSTTPIADLTKNRVGAAINMQTPELFYECPDNGLDVSQVRTVELIAEFARAHPTIATAERKKFLTTEILHEDDAVAYLRSALQGGQTYPTDAERQLTARALMYKNKSATLDSVIHEIWTLGENNLKLIRNGYAFDDSLLFFFGSHSAFPTLFQTYNPSVMIEPVSIYDRSPEALTMLSKTMLRYSEHPEYRPALARFLSEYRQFEWN